MGKYIGRDNPYGLFERQAFNPNGTDTQFSLEYKVGDTTSILVVSNGAVLQPDVDYCLGPGGSSIIFKADPPIGSLYVLYLGRELAVSATGLGSADLTDLDDVSIANPQQDQVLKYTGAGWTNANAFSGNYVDLTNKPDIATLETNVTNAEMRLTTLENTAITNTTISDLVINDVTVGKGGAALPYNTALGWYALANTVGDPATPFGDGDLNTALGSFALYENTTGYLNVAVGAAGTLGKNTTGNSNTAIGVLALGCNEIGNSNVAIGNHSLFNNTTSSKNIAIGSYALNNCVGEQNVAIGYYSGFSISSGSYNVIIGGYTGTSIATSNNNIVISDGQGNVRIKSDDQGQIGINTQLISAQLEITTKNSDTTGLLVNGVVSQTSNLIEAKVGSNLLFAVSGTGNTQILPTNPLSSAFSIELNNYQVSPAIEILKQSQGNYNSIFSVSADGELNCVTTQSLDARISALESLPPPPVSLATLNDSLIINPVANDFLKYDGTNWINEQLSIDALSDVNLSNPSAAQYLGYSIIDGVGTWSNKTISALHVDGLAPVATSGSYNDLIDKPNFNSLSIDALSDVNLSNPSASQYLAYTVIDGVGEWTNKTISAIHVDGLAPVATSGSYNDLTDKPNFNLLSIDALSDVNLSNPSAAQYLGYSIIDGVGTWSNKTISAIHVDGLAPVATSGSYNDLIDKPENVTKVVANFDTELSPTQNVLTIDCSLGTIFLGTLTDSVEKWDFVNFSTASSTAYYINVVVEGNSNYTYGSQCSVNGINITTGILWNKGATPQATNTTNILNFTIIKDSSDKIKVIGGSSYVIGDQNLNFSYDPPAGPANISDAELRCWFDASDPQTFEQFNGMGVVTNETQNIQVWLNKKGYTAGYGTSQLPGQGLYSSQLSGMFLHQNVQNGRPGVFFDGTSYAAWNEQISPSWLQRISLTEYTQVLVYKPVTKVGTLMQFGITHPWTFNTLHGFEIGMDQSWKISQIINYDYFNPTPWTQKLWKKTPTDQTQEYFVSPHRCAILFHKFSSNHSSDPYENGDNNLISFPLSGLDANNTTETIQTSYNHDPINGVWQKDPTSENVFPILFNGGISLMKDGACGYVFEYILYNRALTKSEMLILRDYLAIKWGVLV